MIATVAEPLFWLAEWIYHPLRPLACDFEGNRRSRSNVIGPYLSDVDLLRRLRGCLVFESRLMVSPTNGPLFRVAGSMKHLPKPSTCDFEGNRRSGSNAKSIFVQKNGQKPCFYPNFTENDRRMTICGLGTINPGRSSLQGIPQA